MQRMLHHWWTMLAAFAEQPRLTVRDAPMLSSGAREMLIAWSRPTRQYDVEQRLLHSAFSSQAHERPDAVALVSEQEHLTYAALHHRSNQLAHYLQRRGVQAEDVVGLCLERTGNMLVAMLAVLKAGAGYAPLEPGYPDERLTSMIQNSRLRLVATEPEFQHHPNPPPPHP